MNFSRSLAKRGSVIFKRFKHSRIREVSSCNDQMSDQGCKAVGEDRSAASQGSEATSDFDCNICFESCQDPVVTMCGHLFCWSCLYRWLSSHTGFPECPVCKANVEVNKIIPLYGRGETVCNNSNGEAVAETTAAMNIPSRPAAPRPDVPTTAARHRQNPQVLEFRNHGLSFHGRHLGYGDNIPLSSSAGLFSALLGFQVHGSSEYNARLSYGASVGGRGVTVQQRGWSIHQELILRWYFVLLLVFVTVCFLRF